MAVFAISDLHLPARVKPMDVFGEHWRGHFDRIRADWTARVRPEDLVLLPGDLSWAMRLEEAAEDLASIAALPGTKLLLRGNHDYWWTAIGRVRRMLGDGMYALQNDSILIDGRLYAGTRGWSIPAPDAADDDDLRIYQRERMRLEMSLKSARSRDANAPITVMMHFPPLTAEQPGFSDILEAYGVQDCVYGHLHGAGLYGAVRGEHRGVRYHQVSCDGLDFRMYLLYP
ncbi:MAG: metallophosphoesterase [Clostridia bacterium]|nr:metallophosphoesterase [Clostridia bacterium]MBQ6374856.1 metallophosphoesterase [Clostridia bacterium]